MQKTRLTILFDIVVQQLFQSLRNPWRRISLILVSLLFGNFAATVVATVTGQAASWDVLVALLLVFGCELASWLVYRRRDDRSMDGSRQSAPGLSLLLRSSPQSPLLPSSLALDALNAVKVGFVYGLFVEALKLGS